VSTLLEMWDNSRSMFDNTPIEGMGYVADWYSGRRKYCPGWINCIFQVRQGFSAKRAEIYMFKLWGYFGSVVAGFMSGFVATLSIPPKICIDSLPPGEVYVVRHVSIVPDRRMESVLKFIDCWMSNPGKPTAMKFGLKPESIGDLSIDKLRLMERLYGSEDLTALAEKEDQAFLLLFLVG